MGSWNETCGFTDLPITYDDPVYFMVIRKTPSARSPVFYGFDLYQPVTPLVPATYDDYGGCYMSEEHQKLLHSFVPVSRDGPTMRINDEEYALPTGHWQWMMRKDSYEMMLRMVLRDAETFSIADYERTIREKFSTKISEHRRKWGRHLKSLKHVQLQSSAFVSYDLKRMFDGREAAQVPVYGRVLAQLDDALDTPGKEFISIESCLRLVEPLWPIANLYLALDLVRKTLAPTNGAGSQSWNHRAYKVLGDFISAKALEERANIEDDDDTSGIGDSIVRNAIAR